MRKNFYLHILKIPHLMQKYLRYFLSATKNIFDNEMARRLFDIQLIDLSHHFIKSPKWNTTSTSKKQNKKLVIIYMIIWSQYFPLLFIIIVSFLIDFSSRNDLSIHIHRKVVGIYIHKISSKSDKRDAVKCKAIDGF